MDSTIADLSRLAEKPGVRATIVLSRQTGDIVKSSGLDSEQDSSDGLTHGAAKDNEYTGKLAPIEDIARIAYEHVKATAAMTKILNGTDEDELQLLRIRTKRNELVIVPDARYIAVVIHETPAA